MTPALPAENIYGHTKKLAFVLDRIEAFQAARRGPITVLDFGCGNGMAVSQYVLRLGVKLFGVDIHPPSLDYANAHLGGSEAVFLPDVPGSLQFDVVLYGDVLEHLTDPGAVLARHRELLSPGGIVIGSVPNGFGPFEIEKRVDGALHLYPFLRSASATVRRLLRKPLPPTETLPYNEESGHVQHFTRRRLHALLDRHGFRVTHWRNGAFLGAPSSHFLLLRGDRVARWNARVADRLPSWMVSSWYFAAQREDRPGLSSCGAESADSSFTGPWPSTVPRRENHTRENPLLPNTVLV